MLNFFRLNQENYTRVLFYIDIGWFWVKDTILIGEYGFKNLSFTKIYEDGVWGGEGERFYSGSGSHNNEIARKYIISVNNFLNDLIVEKQLIWGVVI